MATAFARRAGAFRVSGALALFIFAVAQGDCAAQERHWTLLAHQGRAVGHVAHERDIRDGTIRTRISVTLFLEERGRRTRATTDTAFLETIDGTPLRLQRVVRAGTLRTSLQATQRSGQWRIEYRQGARLATSHLANPPGLLFPAAIARALGPAGDARAASLRGFEFDNEGLRFVPVIYDRPGRPGPGWRKQVDGRRMALQFEHGAWVEPISALGLVLDRRPCPTDCRAQAVATLSPLQGLLVASPYRIPASALQGTIRYMLVDANGQVPLLVATGEQAVTIRGNRAIVTVCHDCGVEESPGPGELAAYLQANAWVQSDHPRIRALSLRTARSRGDVARRMKKLVQATREHLDGPIEYVGYASAVEALDSRSGDCTEFAVLLAALARANGIPTRVVVGMAYASRFTGRRDVFGPHAWVQAWTGERWQSFDAGLGEFGAGHLALSIGDGSPGDYQGVAARLRRLAVVAAGSIEPPPEQSD